MDLAEEKNLYMRGKEEMRQFLKDVVNVVCGRVLCLVGAIP